MTAFVLVVAGARAHAHWAIGLADFNLVDFAVKGALLIMLQLDAKAAVGAVLAWRDGRLICATIAIDFLLVAAVVAASHGRLRVNGKVAHIDNLGLGRSGRHGATCKEEEEKRGELSAQLHFGCEVGRS